MAEMATCLESLCFPEGHLLCLLSGLQQESLSSSCGGPGFLTPGSADKPVHHSLGPRSGADKEAAEALSILGHLIMAPAASCSLHPALP